MLTEGVFTINYEKRATPKPSPLLGGEGGPLKWWMRCRKIKKRATLWLFFD